MLPYNRRCSIISAMDSRSAELPSRDRLRKGDAPRINSRRRIPRRAIDEVVRQIVDEFQPWRIILFGSYGYGRPRPESDVDLLVVMDTALRETEQAVRICQAIEYHFGLDLIVRTPETIARRLALGDPFLKEVVSKGQLLYERVND
jgi:predicted nucleotidyltransferase